MSTSALFFNKHVHLVKDSPKLKDFNVIVKNFQLKESKAFSKSIATITEAMSRGFCGFLAQTILKLVAGNLIHSEHYL